MPCIRSPDSRTYHWLLHALGCLGERGSPPRASACSRVGQGLREPRGLRRRRGGEAP
jgi:hypothetical protein